MIDAVIIFDHASSYDTLEDLLKTSRLKWGQYKSIKSFYEAAAIGLVKLDEKRAKDFLLSEFSEINNMHKADILKSHITSALAYLSDVNELTRIFTDICLDKSNSIEMRLETIHSIKENNSDKLFLFSKYI